MIGELVAGFGGTVAGAVLGVAATVARLRTRLRLDRKAHQDLIKADRAQAAVEFAVRAGAARRAVEDFADQLAGNDQLLRARLRRFEQGGGSA